MNYFCHVLLALDQLLNAILGGNENELLSARAYRCRQQKRWAVIEFLLNSLFCDRHHCRRAFEFERDNPQLPRDYLK